MTMPIWLAPMLYLLALLFGYQDPYYEQQRPYRMDQTQDQSLQKTKGTYKMQ